MYTWVGARNKFLVALIVVVNPVKKLKWVISERQEEEVWDSLIIKQWNREGYSVYWSYKCNGVGQ